MDRGFQNPEGENTPLTEQTNTEEKKGWLELGRGLNPYPWYQTRRAKQPVRYDEKSRVWEVYRYADVQRVLKDHTMFSSARLAARQAASGESARSKQSLLTSDPPYHSELRALVNTAFAPRRIAQRSHRITEIVHTLLDQSASAGALDLVNDLAAPLPALVMADLLGTPAEDHRLLKNWADRLAQSLLRPVDACAQETQQEIDRYLRTLLERRRLDPRDDMISVLLAAQIDGRMLSEREVLNFCQLLLAAGSETATNLIGNMFYILLCLQPSTMAEVRARFDLFPGVVEEALRYLSPLQWVARVALRPTIIAGQEIEEGQTLLTCVASANRDEAQFLHPDHFDATRSPNRHLAFGQGIHFCLGASLARLEAQVALSVVLERYETVHVDEHSLERAPAPLFYGLRRFPVTFH